MMVAASYRGDRLDGRKAYLAGLPIDACTLQGDRRAKWRAGWRDEEAVRDKRYTTDTPRRASPVLDKKRELLLRFSELKSRHKKIRTP